MTQFGDFTSECDCERGDCCTIGRKVTRQDKYAAFRAAFGKELRKHRLSAALSQADLAAAAGVGQASIGEYEMGRTVPLITTAHALARVVKLDLAALLELLD